MTPTPERAWKSKPLRLSLTINVTGCVQPRWCSFFLHMIVYRSDSHSGHKHSLGHQKAHGSHIFPPVGKHPHCGVPGPWWFCPSDRIIAERELTPAAARSRERPPLRIWSCQSSTQKSIYTSVGIGFSWPLRHHLLISYDEVIARCCHGADGEGYKTAVAIFNNPRFLPTGRKKNQIIISMFGYNLVCV